MTPSSSDHRLGPQPVVDEEHLDRVVGDLMDKIVEARPSTGRRPEVQEPWTPSTYMGPIPRHPAKWSAAVMAEVDRIVRGYARERYAHPHLGTGQTYRVLDPCAGVGGIHALAEPYDGVDIETTAVEIQREWAAAHPATLVGDARDMPDAWAGTYDLIATSLVYPNRMTDSHEARDACKTCGGSGCRVNGCRSVEEDGSPFCSGENDGHRTPIPTIAQDHRTCSVCKGRGLSRRNTYRHALDEVGATVATGSNATTGWGPTYQALAGDILRSCAAVLAPYGRLLLNMSNHIAGGVEQPVVEWYLDWLLTARNDAGHRVWQLDRVIPVLTPRLNQGANHDARVPYEFLLQLHRRH
jgi:SAM-dependent methyltransferase